MRKSWKIIVSILLCIMILGQPAPVAIVSDAAEPDLSMVDSVGTDGEPAVDSTAKNEKSAVDSAAKDGQSAVDSTATDGKSTVDSTMEVFEAGVSSAVEEAEKISEEVVAKATTETRENTSSVTEEKERGSETASTNDCQDYNIKIILHSNQSPDTTEEVIIQKTEENASVEYVLPNKINGVDTVEGKYIIGWTKDSGNSGELKPVGEKMVVTGTADVHIYAVWGDKKAEPMYYVSIPDSWDTETVQKLVVKRYFFDENDTLSINVQSANNYNLKNDNSLIEGDGYKTLPYTLKIGDVNYNSDNSTSSLTFSGTRDTDESREMSITKTSAKAIGVFTDTLTFTVSFMDGT